MTCLASTSVNDTAASAKANQLKLNFPSDKFLLSNIRAVPALSDVTPHEALSYFHQMLENLMLFHQSSIKFPSAFGRPSSEQTTFPSRSTTLLNSQATSFSSSSISSLASTIVTSSPDYMSPESISSPSSPTSEAPSLHTSKDQTEPTVLKTGLLGVKEDHSGSDTGFPAKHFSVEYILEEASLVAAAVLSGSEYRSDAEYAPRVQYPQTSEDSLEPPQVYSTPEAVKLRNLERKAVSKNELKNKVIIIKRFLGKTKPDISIWTYLLRIHHYCPMSPAVYLAASLYVYRLCISLKSFVLTPLSAHRLILATLRTACKSTEDINFTQKRFATVSGVTTMDLYRLEIAFLFLIDFDICVDSAGLQHHLVTLTELQAQAEKHRQALRKRPRSSDVS